MRKQLIRLLTVAALVVIAASASGGQAAPGRQDGIELLPGEPVSGEILEDQYRRLYFFEGRAGQIVSLQMQRASGDLDPFLVIMAENGVVVAYSDDSGTSRDAIIDSRQLPANGMYTVIATRFGHEHGTTTGEYNLSFTILGTGVNDTPTGTTLQYGDAVLGEIRADKTEDVYVFQAQRGQVVNIHMRRMSGDLDPLLDLLDGQGQPLISGDDNPRNRNAEIVNFPIPVDGLYYIRATRYGRLNGNSSGTYQLTLESVPPDTLGTRPSNARFLQYGDTVTATIDDDTPSRFFQFEAERGDIVIVTARQASGDLSPRVSLLTEDLNTISSSPNNPDEALARLPGASIRESGLYYISVSRADGFQGETSGTFEMEISGRAGMVIDGDIEIVYGGEVTGTITNEQFADTYVFVGKAGEVIRISMRRRSGDLDALVSLQNMNGKLLTVDDDSFAETSQDALIQSFELPEDAIYRIEASRYQRSDGETTGEYVLRLELETPAAEN